MRSLLLVLLLASPLSASAQSLTWEHVGLRPETMASLPSFGADGMLYAAGEYGIRRLAPPYDSTQGWVAVSTRYAVAPLLALGPDTLLATARSTRMARSTDGGVTFTETDGLRLNVSPPVEIPPGVPFGGSIVVPGRTDAADDSFANVSRDRGATWQQAPILGLDPQTFPRSVALAVIPSGLHAGRVVATGKWGLAVSDDGGATYRPVPDWWGYFRLEGTALAVLAGGGPDGQDRLVATLLNGNSPVFGANVVVSDDGGDTWRNTAYLTGDPNAYGSAVVDLGGGSAVVVMDGGHVWASSDGGASWHIEGIVPGALVDPNGSPTSGKVRWALRGPDSRLYVGGVRLGGSNPGWMFRTASPFVVAGAASPEVASGVSLSVRPNPAGASVSVFVTTQEPVEAVVVVLDAVGREVARLHAGPLASGATALSVDTSGWATGVYVVRATVGGHTETARLVVAR